MPSAGGHHILQHFERGLRAHPAIDAHHARAPVRASILTAAWGVVAVTSILTSVPNVIFGGAGLMTGRSRLTSGARRANAASASFRFLERSRATEAVHSPLRAGTLGDRLEGGLRYPRLSADRRGSRPCPEGPRCRATKRRPPTILPRRAGDLHGLRGRSSGPCPRARAPARARHSPERVRLAQCGAPRPGSRDEHLDPGAGRE
jgi:hypothetical protein